MKGKVGKQYSIDTALYIVYKRLTKAVEDLEKDHEAVLEMMKKCTKTAIKFYNKISQEENIDNVGDFGDDFHESNNDYDATCTSEETLINQIAI